MRWRDIGETTCSVARALSVVGDRWTLLILREAFLRTRRFEDFQDHLGITRHLLADRLARLVRHGILARVRYKERPARDEYRLTEKGLDLYPVVVGLTRWGDRWMAGDAGAPVELVHRACGHTMLPELTCPQCGGPVTARDVEARPGPALHALGRTLDDHTDEHDMLGLGRHLRRRAEPDGRRAPRRTTRTLARTEAAR